MNRKLIICRIKRTYILCWTKSELSGCLTRTKQELRIQSLSFPQVFSGNLNFDYSINIKILPNAAFRFLPNRREE